MIYEEFLIITLNKEVLLTIEVGQWQNDPDVYQLYLLQSP